MKTITYFDYQIVEKSVAIIVQRVESIIAKKGRCTLALSGGKSPKELYQKLATKLDPEVIDIVLVDERVVGAESEYSNLSFVKKCLGANWNVHSYVTEGEDYFQQSLVLLDRFETIDLAILGVGTDGHTASLFSDDDLEKEGRLVIVKRAKEDFERLSFSFGELLSIGQLIFYLSDSSKKPILKKILDSTKSNKYPAGRVIHEHPDVSIISLES